MSLFLIPDRKYDSQKDQTDLERVYLIKKRITFPRSNFDFDKLILILPVYGCKIAPALFFQISI